MTSGDAWLRNDVIIPFSDLEPLIDNFKNALAKVGVTVLPGTILDHLCELTLRLARGTLTPAEQLSCETLESIAGLVTFAKKVVRVLSHKDFAELTDHLKLLESGKIKLNAPDTSPNEEGPKLFELLIALSVFSIGSNVKLDDPSGGSRGTNPDVLADIDGQLWGVACKLLYGPHGQTLKRAAAKGIEQIEKCAATTGVVVISINNLLDHAAIRGDVTLGWPSLADPLKLMVDMVERKKTQLQNEVSPGDLNSLFVGKKAQPVIILYAHSMALVRSAVNGRPIPALIRFLSGIPFGDLSASVVTLNRLNLSLQDLPDMAQN